MAEVYADLLLEHARGDWVRQIAERHGLTRSTTHRRILAEGSKLIESIERDLLLAELTRHHPSRCPPGSGKEKRTRLIPPQTEGDRMAALDMFFWLARRLRERGWLIEGETRSPPGGGVLSQLSAVPKGDHQ